MSAKVMSIIISDIYDITIKLMYEFIYEQKSTTNIIQQ